MRGVIDSKERADDALLFLTPPRDYETWKDIGISYKAAGAMSIRFFAGLPPTLRNTTRRLLDSFSKTSARTGVSPLGRSSGMRVAPDGRVKTLMATTLLSRLLNPHRLVNPLR